MQNIITIVFFVVSVFGYANDKIPASALEGQLKRQAFAMKASSFTPYNIYKEEDFRKVDFSRDVLLNLQNDIKLTTPISINTKRCVRIAGNGHLISEKYPQPVAKESTVYEAISWDYDEAKQLCTIKLPQQLSKLNIKEADSISIAYELWFVRQTDKVHSAKKGELTFYCRQLYKPTVSARSWTPKTKFYFVYPNSKKAAKGLPHLINISKEATVEINNLRLKGSTSYAINSSGIIKVVNCTLSDGRYGAIKSNGKLFANNCNITGMTCRGISCGYNSYSDIENCTFENIGLKGSNTACINSPGKIYIGGCTFYNFNYSAINIGNMSTEDANSMGCSIVENNKLYWDASWTEKIKDYGLKDSGAIYIGTNNSRAIVRNNTITNFGGHGFNRAIFCDDGAYNLTIYQNVISGTQNSYDIDSRDCSKTKPRKVPKGYAMNTNNYIGYNTCSGRIRTESSSVTRRHNCRFEHNTK